MPPTIFYNLILRSKMFIKWRLLYPYFVCNHTHRNICKTFVGCKFKCYKNDLFFSAIAHYVPVSLWYIVYRFIALLLPIVSFTIIPICKKVRYVYIFLSIHISVHLAVYIPDSHIFPRVSLICLPVAIHLSVNHLFPLSTASKSFSNESSFSLLW